MDAGGEVAVELARHVVAESWGTELLTVHDLALIDSGSLGEVRCTVLGVGYMQAGSPSTTATALHRSEEGCSGHIAADNDGKRRFLGKASIGVGFAKTIEQFTVGNHNKVPGPFVGSRRCSHTGTQ